MGRVVWTSDERRAVMRVIEAFDEPVRAVAVSPDGRFLAARTDGAIVLREWVTGRPVHEFLATNEIGQLAFAGDGSLIYSEGGKLVGFDPTRIPGMTGMASGFFSGAAAVSADGKTLVATRAGYQQMVSLERWELPAWRPVSGFDYWSPFERLAFSPNGEFLAGINRNLFELRITVSGGLNGRQQARGWGHSAYLTFPRDNATVLFGWDTEFQVMETRGGSLVHRVPAAREQLFLDAAFTGNGRHLVVVDGTPVMAVWSSQTWGVVGGYDWDAGGLTCVAVAADGLSGVCGTDTGRLVVFDVDD